MQAFVQERSLLAVNGPSPSAALVPKWSFSLSGIHPISPVRIGQRLAQRLPQAERHFFSLAPTIAWASLTQMRSRGWSTSVWPESERGPPSSPITPQPTSPHCHNLRNLLLNPIHHHLKMLRRLPPQRRQAVLHMRRHHRQRFAINRLH